ncbi:hypothetical protein HK098_007113 [Nowakowskiella sp. JEL0407]|nr:hypothetical protein HK098_007113 [Nowakowskiella sp. JEL0407]
MNRYYQCGGQYYTGSTTCCSGSVCTYKSVWYSQCIPGGPPVTTTTTTSPSPVKTTAATSPSPATSNWGPAPTTAPNGLFPLPYLKCTDVARTQCSWVATGAIMDGGSKARSSYSVTAVSGGVKLSQNNSPRLYFVNTAGTAYERFNIKNKAITVTVDVSHVPCGYIAALWLVNMNLNGQIGTGYCDAQNTCSEMDILESNVAALTCTSHSCSYTGGSCDPWGCAASALKDSDFGPGKKIDTKKPITITTSFYTSDNTENGSLSAIKQEMRQDGVVHSQTATLTDSYCSTAAATYWTSSGGFPTMSTAMSAGQVMSLTMWGSGGDTSSWLDGGASSNPNCAAVASPQSATFSNFIISPLA